MTKNAQMANKSFILPYINASPNVSGYSCLTSGTCVGNSDTGSLTTTIASVTIPDVAIGFRIYPKANSLGVAHPIRFAVSENPAAVGSITLNTCSVGGIAQINVWNEKLIGTGTSRTLRFLGTASSAAVDLEFF